MIPGTTDCIMSFNAMIERVRAQCRRIGGAQADAMVVILSNVAVLDLLRRYYKGDPSMKLFWRKSADRLAGALEMSSRSAEGNDLATAILNTVRALRALKTSADTQVRQWATIAAAIDACDEEAIGCLAPYLCSAMGPEGVVTVRVALSWTIAECARRGEVIAVATA